MKTKLLYLFLSCLIISCTERSPITDPAILSQLPDIEVLINEEGAFDGNIFLRKITSPGAQFAINSKGEVMWYQMSDSIITRVYTPYEKSYLALYTKKEIHEITYNGDTLLKLSYGESGYDRILHHEIIKDGNNNIVAITEEILPLDLSGLGGEKFDTVRTHGIIKLSRTGEKLWSWSLDDVLDPLTYPEINRIKKDWGHANALSIDVDGNYLLSWRDFGQIWKINSESGEVIWKYGGESIANKADKFYGQHDININLDGDYMILDNGLASVRRYTRALMFNTFGDSIRNTLSIQLPDSLFTVRQGSVYQFAEDRFLFSSTMRKKLAVTNRKGDILWLAKSDAGFYRAYYIEKEVL
jgi:arylsulfate sulfotransferase